MKDLHPIPFGSEAMSLPLEVRVAAVEEGGEAANSADFKELEGFRSYNL